MAILLIGIVGLVYVNSLGNAFHFDDEHSIVENPHIRQLKNIPTFFTTPQMFSRTSGSEMYRPFLLVSYALNYRLASYDVRGFHVVNIFIHLVCVVLVYQLFCFFSPTAKEWAWFAALGWGIHPLTAEPVNYISSRSESLAALFYLASVLLYVRQRQGVAWLSVLCFIGGLLSKSVVITLPLMLLLYEACCGQCLRFARWRQHVLYWVVAGGYLFATGRLIHEALIDAPVRDFKIQLATQLKAALYYLKLMIIPHSLSVEHAFHEALDPFSLTPILAGFCLVSILLAGWIWRAKLDRETIFWCAWIVLSLMPTFVVPLNLLISERRLYIPLIGLFGLFMLLRKISTVARGRWIGIVLLMGFGILSFQRNQVWANEKSLWLDACVKGPTMVRPYVRLGGVWRREGRIDLAEQAYHQALILDPENVAAHNNSGNIKRDQGDLYGAEQAYLQALKIAPAYPEAQINLGALYTKQKRFDVALEIFDKAQKYGAHHAELYNNWGIALLATGQFEPAVLMLRQAINLGGEESGIYFNLGGALEGTGDDTAAVTAYQEALTLAPENPKPYYNLGLLYERRGKTAKALEAYRHFLSLWHGSEQFKTVVQNRIATLARVPYKSPGIQD